MLKDPRLLWPALVALSFWNCSLQHEVNRAYRLADRAESDARQALEKLHNLRISEIERQYR